MRTPEIWEIGGARLGIMVSDDIADPLVAAVLARKGVDALVSLGFGDWGPFLDARAVESHVPVFARWSCGSRAVGADGQAIPFPASLEPGEMPRSWAAPARVPAKWREFAVQRHEETPERVHYDLLLEDGLRLLCWSLPRPPEELFEADVEALSPHRMRYLSYCGSISDGRGQVRVHDRGLARFDRQGNTIRLEMRGGRFSGILSLTQPMWRLRASEPCSLPPP